MNSELTGLYHNIGSGDIYENEQGHLLLVRSVNRKYAGSKKAPTMYLQHKDISEEKFVYLSGLFTTNKTDIFSFDVKNRFGAKAFYKCSFIDGEVLITAT